VNAFIGISLVLTGVLISFKNKKFHAFCFFLWIFGTAAIYGHLDHLALQNGLKQYGQTATATIVQMTPKSTTRDAGIKRPFATLKFTDIAGQTQIIEAPLNKDEWYKTYRAGNTMKILYDTRNPHKHRLLKPEDTYRPSFGRVIMGLVAFAAALMIRFDGTKRKK
jgi:hypothetical protein